VHAKRELVRGVGRFEDRAHHGREPRRRLMLVEGRARLGRQIENGVRDAQARLVELRLGDPSPRRDHERIEKAPGDRQLGVRSRARPLGESRREVKDGIGERRRAHDLGARQAQLFINRLKRSIVEQRDADGGIGGERRFKHRLNLARDLRILRAAVHPMHAPIEPRPRDLLHPLESQRRAPRASERREQSA
jgi:hypothetical protein